VLVWHLERMFEDRASKRFLLAGRPPRGLGRVFLLVAAMLIVSAQLAYGSNPARYGRVVVSQGDTLWSIAQARSGGDPRARVDQIMRINNLTSPTLVPGQTLRIPID